MQNENMINLLARVAQSASGRPPGTGAEGDASILLLAAASYGLRPSADATVPTGFDPMAVRLFEAIVEGAFLVATADAVFDATERATFEKVVVAACGGVVAPEPIAALVSDLGDQLREDGLERRISAVAQGAAKKEQAREVLRIAALLAQASDGISTSERQVLSGIAAACHLDESEVDAAISDVRTVLRA